MNKQKHKVVDNTTHSLNSLQCRDMLVDFQHDLIHWFMKAQSRDLAKWLCAKRVLVDDNQGLLFSSVYSVNFNSHLGFIATFPLIAKLMSKVEFICICENCLTRYQVRLCC